MGLSAAPSPTDRAASSDSGTCAAGTTPGSIETNGPTELIVFSR
jgi:hypothetical protein